MLQMYRKTLHETAGHENLPRGSSAGGQQEIVN